MDIQIEMSAANWHNLLGYLDPNTSAFSTVKGAIENNENTVTTPLAKVILTCDENDAVELLRAAQKFFPEAASSIKAALDNPCRQ